MIRKLIDKPIAVTMSLIAIVVLSVTAIGLIPVSIAPDVDIPKVTVSVTDADMSARMLEEVAVAPLRSQLMQVNNLNSLHAETKDGSSNIYLTFEYGSDIDYAFIEVNEKIDKSMNDLPKEMDRPNAIKASATDIPSFYINVTLKEPDEAFVPTDLHPVSSKFTELTTFTRQVLTKRIEQLPSVAVVDVSGYINSEVLIVPKRDQLLSLGISVSQLETAIRNRNLSLGNVGIRDGEYYYNVRFDSKITSHRDLQDVYLNIEDRLFKLPELADIHFHPQKIMGMVQSDSQSAVSMAIIKNSDAQMSDLKEEVNKTIELFNKEYPDINFTVTRDQTSLLDYLIGNLVQNILMGAALACLVLFFFIYDFRTPFLIIISIPIALIISMLAFYVVGITINIISLSGLVLGVGMMVDNSIIVIDNITQHWTRGKDLKDAAAQGATEVFAAMLSSVLTTCSIFIPLIFLSGIAGALFYDQAISITITLFSSLIVAVVVIPVYYALFFRNKTKREESKLLKKLMVVNYAALYEKGLVWLMRRQAVVIVSYILFIVLGVILFSQLPKRNLPPITEVDTILFVDWNDKISVEQNSELVSLLVEQIDEQSEQVTSIIGNNQYMLSHTPTGSLHSAVIYIKAYDSESLSEIKQKLTQYLDSNYSNILFNFSSSGNIFDMIFSANEVELIANVRNSNGDVLDPSSLNELISKLKVEIPDVPINSVAYNEQIELLLDRERMALYKVTTESVVAALKNAFSTNTLFSISQGQSSVDIVVGDKHTSLDEVLKSTYVTVDKIQLPITNFITESKSREFKVILSDSGRDYYPIALDVDERDVERTMAIVESTIAQIGSFEVNFSGGYFSNREMISELSIILIVSVLLLFFILATQFESLVQPFIILSELIVDVVGAFFALWLVGSSINLMSMIGIIVMCGIVINDSILKIDTINRLRQDGYGLLRAILTGGARRLTPIIMTSLTTILAVAPFLFTGNLGSDLQFPLSVALIGGMILGTIVSVFFVPVLYYQIYKKRR